MMNNKSKDNQDIQSERSSISNVQDQYAKSFSFGRTKNFVNITLPNVQIKGKQFYKKQPYCTICFKSFTTTFRQHHCRICVNAVCADCSRSMINKQRACDICVLKFTNPHQQKKKKEMLQTLETLCAFLIYRKNQKMNELQKLKGPQNLQQIEQQLQSQNKQIQQLQQQNLKLKIQHEELQQNLNKVRQTNSQIQNKISQIQRQIGSDQYM